MSDNFTISEVFDLKDGTVVNRIELNLDPNKDTYTDVRIIDGTEKGLKYLIMTNTEVNVYLNNKIVESQKCPEGNIYVYSDYDREGKKIVVGSLEDGSQTLNVYPVDHSLPPFNLSYNPERDYIISTSQYILILKAPTKTTSFMIVAHRIVEREMIFNDVKKEVGADFQVNFRIMNRSKISFYRPMLLFSRIGKNTQLWCLRNCR